MRMPWYRVLLMIAMILIEPVSGPALAQLDDASVSGNNLSAPGDTPRRHFRAGDVADLDTSEAARIYEIVRGALALGYSASGFEGTASYQALARYNDKPYVSATHGNHYVNNYANDIAVDYGKFEQAGTLPQGSIVFKDSFTVTETRQSFSDTASRQITLGPLFVMRKMEAGFNPSTGDWQYIQIQPDGKILGMTHGEGSDQVRYCIACHLAREQNDHLYFVPDARRRRP